MAKTNTLTSHHPERNNHRVDKMSPISEKKSNSWMKSFMVGTSKKFHKKFASKKRRQFLNNISNEKI